MTDTIKLPNPEGVVPLGRVEPGPTPAVEKPPETLWRLAETHAFFNHGLFFTAGGLDVDPVADHWVRHDLMGRVDPLVCQISSPAPFPGMPGKARAAAYWGGAIFAVPKEYWDGLLDTLRGVAAVDRRRRFYWQACSQSVALVDPTEPGGGRSLDVTLFGVDGSRGRWGYHGDAPAGRPMAAWPVSAVAADPRVARVRDAILDDSHDHLRAQEPTEHGTDVRGIDPAAALFGA